MPKEALEDQLCGGIDGAVAQRTAGVSWNHLGGPATPS